MGNNVDSLKMLPSGKEKMPGGDNDESREQARIVGNDPTAVSQGE
jgi:hypothetical protein